MKVTLGIALSLAMLMLTAAAIAEPSETLNEALHEVLLPGTTVVAGNEEDNDFYIATEADAAKIIDKQKQVKEAQVANAVAEKHEEEYRKVQLEPKTLAAVNVDMQKLSNKYAVFDRKATLLKGGELVMLAKTEEKISTQKFNPVIVASNKKSVLVARRKVTDYPLEPVLSAMPRKPVPVVKRMVVVADGASKKRRIEFKPVTVVSRHHTKSVRLALKSASHPRVVKKAMVAQSAKNRKHQAAGVVKPYKFVVKTVSYDRNRRLKLETSTKGKRLTSNVSTKNHSRYEFKVIHLYR